MTAILDLFRHIELRDRYERAESDANRLVSKWLDLCKTQLRFHYGLFQNDNLGGSQTQTHGAREGYQATNEEE